LRNTNKGAKDGGRIKKGNFELMFMIEDKYSKTPIYRRPWEHGKGGGKSGAAVNQGFPFLSP
jgi:hypothetical protein